MPTELPRSGRLAAKVVAMTGATGGLGLATARLMAREGAKLALTDIDEQALDILKTDLIAEGTEVVAVPGDATLPETHAALVINELPGDSRHRVVSGVNSRTSRKQVVGSATSSVVLQRTELGVERRCA